MEKRGALAGVTIGALFALASPPALAVVAGPITQLTNDPADELEPAISGSRVVWTEDTGQTNGYDIFSLVLGGGPAVDITPRPGGQFFDDIDGNFAVSLDSSNGAYTVTVLYDLTTGNPVTLDPGDGFSTANPSISAVGPTVALTHVDPASDIYLVAFDSSIGGYRWTDISAGDSYVDDDARIHGDFVVWQKKDGPNGERHIWAYQISKKTAYPLTTGAGNDDTSPDTDGTNVVFTRNGVDILAIPAAGGAITAISVGAPGTRDRARISGANIVWDDHRGGDCDVWVSSIGGGGGALLVGGAGDQYLTDIDGTRVVYTGGPVGGPHDIFLVDLVQCMADTDCGSTQICDPQSHTCVAKPQCSTTADCSGGLVCVSGACVPCASNAQCTNGNVCQQGVCGQPQCTTNAQCGAQVCVNNACVPCTNDSQCGNGLVCQSGACTQPQDDPDGCGKNVHAIETVLVTQDWHTPVAAAGTYNAKQGHTYSVCVVNGAGDPGRRTSSLLFFHDFEPVMTPADFKPNNDPPAVVVRPLTPWKLGSTNVWLATLFGPHPPEAVKIKILESN